MSQDQPKPRPVLQGSPPLLVKPLMQAPSLTGVQPKPQLQPQLTAPRPPPGLIMQSALKELPKYSPSFVDDEEPLDIPMPTSSVHQTMLNVQRQGKLLNQCQLDLFSLKYWSPEPMPTNLSSIPANRPLQAFAIGYFTRAKNNKPLVLKKIRDLSINTDFSWAATKDIFEDCPDILQDHRNINKVYLQFSDMLNSKSVLEMLSEYGTVDLVIEVVLFGLVAKENKLAAYMELKNCKSTSILCKFYKQFEELLEVKVVDSEKSVKVEVGPPSNSFCVEPQSNGSYFVKLVESKPVEISKPGISLTHNVLKFSNGGLNPKEMTSQPHPNAETRRISVPTTRK